MDNVKNLQAAPTNVGSMPFMSNQTPFIHYLNIMGIELWQQRVASQPPSLELTSAESASPNHVNTSNMTEIDPPTIAQSETSWPELETNVHECKACELHQTRKQAVFGVGDRQATWMIIGEAPGADEDQQGEPFVGRAGKLLNAMLYALKLPRESVYIANILKCRPPDNRTPTQDEMVQCSPFLKQQIELIQPKIILALGSVAAHYLLATDTPIGKLRGQTFTYSDTNIPVVVTYHPAYLLRRPTEKRKSWQDLQLAIQVLANHLS